MRVRGIRKHSALWKKALLQGMEKAHAFKPHHSRSRDSSSESVMVVSNWIRNNPPTCKSHNVCHAVFLAPILFTGSNNVLVTCKSDINGEEDLLSVYLFWLRSHSCCLCRKRWCPMPAPVLFSQILSVRWQTRCVMKCHTVVCYRDFSNSSFLLYFYLSILDNLCNGKFHKHLQDLFAPLVVRYVDLMESSIAQSIHRGFERESWEPVK